MLKKSLLIVLLTTLAVALGANAALAETSGKRIALSNNYAGNSWRQAMLKSWDKVTSAAVEKGIVAEATAFTTAENQVTEQAAQIQNLILQGYDAIVINAASPEGLNGAVKQACDAGITVVSFDGIVTESCAYRIAVDFKNMGAVQIDYLASACPRAAMSSKSAAWPACSSMTPSAPAFMPVSPNTRNSRSSAPYTATGPRPSPRRRLPASCRPCRTSRRW